MSFGQSFTEKEDSLVTSTGTIYGTLYASNAQKMPIVLIIAGSGPTDRNGNNPFAKNNSLQQIADSLAAHNIATLRFDKRGIAQSKSAMPLENDLRFDNYISDATQWIEHLRADKKISKIIVLGHSEGSLIGMIAAKKGTADKYISLAGAGESADKLLKTQLANEKDKDVLYSIVDSLKAGKEVKKLPQTPLAFGVFRPSVQPYMISWLRYEPQKEIKKLSIPILILQGDNDLQVSVSDANKLHIANPKSKIVLLPKMNHVLKDVNTKEENISSYTNPDLPIDQQLVHEIVKFIQQ